LQGKIGVVVKRSGTLDHHAALSVCCFCFLVLALVALPLLLLFLFLMDIAWKLWHINPIVRYGFYDDEMAPPC